MIFQRRRARHRNAPGDRGLSEDDVEVRRLSLTNRSDRSREIEMTSYRELALAAPADDLAHPAFGKLFLETEYLPACPALLCARRPRRPRGRQLWAIHALSVEGRMQAQVEWETDRRASWAAAAGPTIPSRSTAARSPERRAPFWTRSSACGPGSASLPALRPVSFATGVAREPGRRGALAQRYHDPGAPAAPSPLPSPTPTSSFATWASSVEEAQLFVRLGSRSSSSDGSLRAEPSSGAQHPGPVRAVETRDLRRPSSAARARGRGRTTSPGPAGAQGPRILASQGPEPPTSSS